MLVALAVARQRDRRARAPESARRPADAGAGAGQRVRDARTPTSRTTSPRWSTATCTPGRCAWVAASRSCRSAWPWRWRWSDSPRSTTAGARAAARRAGRRRCCCSPPAELIGVFISGSNVKIPAHYHGCIVGVTLALMGLVYLLLPQLGRRAPVGRLATWQPTLYGAGQLLHIIGLVWSGGYGVQRKVAGAEQVLRSHVGDRRHGPDGARRAGRDHRRPACSCWSSGGRCARPPEVGPGRRAAPMIACLQAGLRWLFMRVEALFNRAFGDRLNPFYHLGVDRVLPVLDQSPPAACTSTPSSTPASPRPMPRSECDPHGQWYFGGILRSVHRYASDAMVVVMLVHMLRHFAFDRHARFPRLLLADRRRPDLAGLCLRHQRLHAAVGPAGAVRHHRQLRVARLAAVVSAAR